MRESKTVYYEVWRRWDQDEAVQINLYEMTKIEAERMKATLLGAVGPAGEIPTVLLVKVTETRRVVEPWTAGH